MYIYIEGLTEEGTVLDQRRSVAPVSRETHHTHTNTQTVYNTKGTRAHTHRELIRTWLWEPKGSSRTTQ